MQVRCPHCSQVFSTQSGGDQPCPSCGASIHVPDPAAAGAAGTGATGSTAFGGGGAGFGGPAPERVPTPWERRDELGVVQGWWQTLLASTLRPQEFWPSVEPRARFFPTLLWAWLVAGLSALLAVPVFLLQWGQIQQAVYQTQASMGSGADNVVEMLSGGPLPMALGIFIGTMLFYPVVSLITVALVHVSAKLVGAANEPFEATARAFYYAQGPQLASFIPLAGTLAAIYSYVLFGWGLKELHRTTTGRAALAILLPVLVICVCCCGVFAASMAAMASTLQGVQY